MEVKKPSITNTFTVFVFIVYLSHLQFYLSLQHFIYKWEQSLSAIFAVSLLFSLLLTHALYLYFNCITADALLFTPKEFGQQGPGSCKSTFYYLSGTVFWDNLTLFLVKICLQEVSWWSLNEIVFNGIYLNTGKY